MKKLLLTLGSIGAVVAPVASVVACGTDTKTPPVVATKDTDVVVNALKAVKTTTLLEADFSALVVAEADLSAKLTDLGMTYAIPTGPAGLTIKVAKVAGTKDVTYKVSSTSVTTPVEFTVTFNAFAGAVAPEIVINSLHDFHDAFKVSGMSNPNVGSILKINIGTVVKDVTWTQEAHAMVETFDKGATSPTWQDAVVWYVASLTGVTNAYALMTDGAGMHSFGAVTDAASICKETA